MSNLPLAQTSSPVAQRPATSPLTSIQREMNRLFDEFYGAFRSESAMLPRIDVRDGRETLEVTVELPGLDRDSVTVDVDDDLMVISGEKKADTEAAKGDLHVSERSYGAFARAIRLPAIGRPILPSPMKPIRAI